MLILRNLTIILLGILLCSFGQADSNLQIRLHGLQSALDVEITPTLVKGTIRTLGINDIEPVRIEKTGNRWEGYIGAMDVSAASSQFLTYNTEEEQQQSPPTIQQGYQQVLERVTIPNAYTSPNLQFITVSKELVMAHLDRESAQEYDVDFYRLRYDTHFSGYKTSGTVEISGDESIDSLYENDPALFTLLLVEVWEYFNKGQFL